ncbi:MAG TPA: excinuclease ABC subunit UvrC [Roseiarcus sp.]|jgi:excinuclease ABC subunit C|nr:excinuclease ABC subunit UvrC [Roseiarcus sp.]
MTLPPKERAPADPPLDAPPETPLEDDEAEAGFELALAEDDAAPNALARGAAAIKDYWRQAPVGPGVYRMIAADGEVLYVGKAHSIKKRIASYMRPEMQSARIAKMVARTASMVFVSTQTEAEALLLEANYIKQMKPRYNVLLRDDKSFPYILVTSGHRAPQLMKHRGARSIKGAYFGPFASAGAVGRTLNALQRAFLLRTCSDSYFDNRTRPCLLFQIKRCSGPCTHEISDEDYQTLVEEARDFLSGRSRAVRERMAEEMGEAAEALAFEKAARLRDRIAALSAIQGEQSINPRSIAEADVFAIAEEAGQFCIEVFFFRTYQNWGNRAYFPRADRTLRAAEVLDSFLAQFYVERPAPRLVLLSHDVESAAVLAEALCIKSGRRIAVGRPRRGEKRELVENALRNAREALSRKLADAATQEKLLAALGQAFGFEGPIGRVEVFDNSHIMGSNAIGAMIVAGADGFMKAHYRTFNIKNMELTPGDDYAMMREVLTRRFARLAKAARRTELTATGETVPAAQPESAGGFPEWPDLVLIDGGRGQLEAAREVFATLRVEGVRLAAIAKGADRNAGRETFFIPGREPFRLPARDPALYFVQRLRDEAHRFAIGTHRAKRKREFVKSPLDEIPGIGPARKRALLNAFGTAKAVARAGLADLEKVAGVNEATARIVYEFFHEGG